MLCLEGSVNGGPGMSGLTSADPSGRGVHC